MADVGKKTGKQTQDQGKTQTSKMPAVLKVVDQFFIGNNMHKQFHKKTSLIVALVSQNNIGQHGIRHRRFATVQVIKSLAWQQAGGG